MTLTASAGCGGLAPTKIVKDPNAPMLILSGSGTLRVSVFDSDAGELIEYGKIRAKDVAGWTLTPFDWDAALGDDDATDG